MAISYYKKSIWSVKDSFRGFYRMLKLWLEKAKIFLSKTVTTADLIASSILLDFISF